MKITNELKNYGDFLSSNEGNPTKLVQAQTVANCLVNNFNFKSIEALEIGSSKNIEEGCFGLFLAEIAKNNKGSLTSVDVVESVSEESKTMYSENIKGFKVNHVVDDSINFLKNYKGKPNLVYLDSWYLDLKNPLSSMLHTWFEFEAIKDKMPVGSICVINDNYLKNTWVDWNLKQDGELIGTERIDITYDTVGKGSLIYHWCLNYNNDWEIIGDHYTTGINVNLIIQKISK